jgi:lysozyme
MHSFLIVLSLFWLKKPNFIYKGSVIMMHGVDLSHWQGEVDFAKLASAGIKFCFLKFTEGTNHIDDRGLEYLHGARAHGMPAGAYHYFLPKYDPIEQAEHFVLTMSRHEGYAGELILPPVIDVEVKASSVVLQKTIMQFLEYVEDARGITPILYTSPGFWRSYVGKWDEVVRFPLWVAHYGTTYPSQFYPWASWKFWQFTSAGRVPGVVGNVDLNLFPGEWLDLLKLCKHQQSESEYQVEYARAEAKSPTVQP